MCKISAVQQGYEAFHLGKKETDNPYTKGSSEGMQWEHGFVTEEQKYMELKKKFRI